MSKTNLSSRCVHQLFEEQVERTPDALAVVDKNERLCYGALNMRSNRVANRLRSLGVGLEVAVGIYCRRNVGMVVGVLAVLKTGGVYVPLDVKLPKERLRMVIEDSQCRVIVAERQLACTLPPDVRVMLVDDENAFMDCWGENVVGNGGMAWNAAAYILYTSGSMGEPKGVVVEHGQVVNYIEGMKRRAKFPLSASFAMVQPLSVDSSVTVLYASLTQGGCLHLISEDLAMDPIGLGSYFEMEGIDCLKIAPSHLAALQTCSEPHRLLPRSRLIVGGEASRRDWLIGVQAMAGECEIFNHYGPTETTVGVLMHRVQASGRSSGGGTVPIGRPLANVRAYVLDGNLRLAPKGVAGELYIGGASVARGYWQRADLTGTRFVADPYAGDGTRMYRTGDLARWREDGELEFLGRLDDQVKIRGFRIELGEIEAALRKHEWVSDALVMVRGGEEDKRLLAYVISDWETESERESWDSYIGEWKTIYESPEDFEVEGWQSSYTGQPIAAEEMETWLEETVKGLERLRPAKVLEIGCGSGAVLKRLAPLCESYVGLDFSEHALRQLKLYLSGRSDMKHVELRQAVAHELSFLPEDSVDLVVLNSVVQYFPDIEYLLKVLQGATRVTRRGGHIYVGDVRSLPLWRAFHLSVQMHKAAENLTLEELRLRVHYAQRNEKELLIDPGFFAELVRRLEKVGWAECSLKAGAYDNELSRFRYDVAVNIGEKKGLIEPGCWLKWDEEGDWRKELERHLAAEPGKSIGVKGVVDARVAQWAAAVGLLDSRMNGLGTVEDLRTACAEHRGEHADTVLQLARGLGVGVSQREYGKDGIYDLVFNPQWHEQDGVSGAEGDMGRGYYRRYGNAPARVTQERALGQRLREYLGQKLPNYMVPAAVTVLPFWPLTPHGKVDRNALPEVEVNAAGVDEYEAPQGEAERELAKIWEELLEVERVGRKDNFFELGGHSLLATRLVSRVQARLGLEMATVTVFEAPRVVDLVRHLMDKTAEQVRFGPVLALRPHGSLPPLFCLPPAIGLGWSYAGLLRELNPQRPVYAFHDRYLAGQVPLPLTIAEIAGCYVSAIKEIQPEGPYHLLGWSFGGMVAHEVACRLQQRDEVGSLVLLDSYLSGMSGEVSDESHMLDEPGTLQAFAELLRIDPEHLNGKPVSLTAIVAAARASGNLFGFFDLEQAKRMLRLLVHNSLLGRNFLPNKFSGDALFFLATKGRTEGQSPDAWTRYIDGRIVKHEIFCRHSEMADPEPIHWIGRLLEQHLQMRESGSDVKDSLTTLQ